MSAFAVIPRVCWTTPGALEKTKPLLSNYSARFDARNKIFLESRFPHFHCSFPGYQSLRRDSRFVQSSRIDCCLFRSRAGVGSEGSGVAHQSINGVVRIERGRWIHRAPETIRTDEFSVERSTLEHSIPLQNVYRRDLRWNSQCLSFGSPVKC